VRAKVSELVLATDPAKLAVTEYFQTKNAMPANASAVDFTAASSTYVSSVAYTTTGGTNATITATARGDAAITGKTITLVGTGTESNGNISWVCGGDIAAKYRPASCK
jgi:type IV pilus assembly protein PilA